MEGDVMFFAEPNIWAKEAVCCPVCKFGWTPESIKDRHPKVGHVDPKILVCPDCWDRWLAMCVYNVEHIASANQVKPAELFLVADTDGNIHAGEDGDGYPWVLVYNSREEAEKTLKWLGDYGNGDGGGQPIEVQDAEYHKRRDFSKYRVVRYVAATGQEK